MESYNLIIRVLCGGGYAGILRTKISSTNADVLELYLCGIKFAVSANDLDITISTSSTTVTLNDSNGWFSGITSEPERNREKRCEEFTFEAEASVAPLQK